MTGRVPLLLVEDNPADAYLTRETLESGALDMDVSVAADAGEARAILINRPPSAAAVAPPRLILLDLNLPGASGHELLREIRSSSEHKATPVVVLTSSEAPDDIAQSYALGANSYVTKPVGLEAFQRAIGAVRDFWLQAARLP